MLAEADTRDLSAVAARLDDEVDRRTAASGPRFPVSLTIGSVHSAPPHELSLDDMLKQADQFMYERKHRGPAQPE